MPNPDRFYEALDVDGAVVGFLRAGFRDTGRHVRHFERWSDVEFVEMEETAGPG